MRDKRIAVGPRSSGMEQHARQVLKSLGWDFDDIRPVYLAFQPGGEAMRAGRADAQLQCCIPNAGFTELATLAKLRVVEFSEPQLSKIVAESPDYGVTLLKKGTFPGHEEDTPTLALSNGFITHARADEQTIYMMTKVMLAKLKEMAEKSPQFATVEALLDEAKAKGEKPLEVSAPLHPGAVRALKEAGILK
jgi:TRAP transporter TAXI family solute receptor